MNDPLYFENSETFHDWLEAHAASATELLVGFYKVDSGRASMSWSESVDQAICFGWIDGIRKRIDDESYSIRFTPRKTSSIWSAINVAKFAQLQSQGRIAAAGAMAYSHRKEHKSAIYSYEQEDTAELSPQELKDFKRATLAWTFFETTPPGYRKVMLHWVTTAKKAETRAARLARLLQACAAGLRLR